MIKINILQDLNNWAYEYLKNVGLKNAVLDNALYQYCNILLRKLRPKPRKIEKSKDFTCPFGYEKKLKFFEKAVTSGKDLTPFMSKSIQDASFRDKMIFDWGLFHFHLSDCLDKNNNDFMERSDYLLVSYVDFDCDDIIYFLKIRSHKSNLWTEQDLIRCLADNWPNITNKFRLIDIASLTPNVTDDDYKNLRRKNTNTMIDLHDGRVYIGPNWGITSNGFSIKALNLYNRLTNDAMIIQKNTLANANVLLETIRDNFGVSIKDISLKLVKPNIADYIFKVDNCPNLFVRVLLIDESRQLRFLVGESIEQLTNEEIYNKSNL